MWNGDYKIERILCPVDFSAATPHGLAVASDLARRTGASLRILHVRAQPYPQLWPGGAHEPAMARTWFERLYEAAGTRLQRLIEEAIPEEVPAEPELRGGRARVEISEVARRSDVDLIVMPRNGRTELSRVVFGSTADVVVRSTDCPVLTIHPSEGDPKPLEAARILVATDLSPLSDVALPAAIGLARALEAEVVLAHVAITEDPLEEEWDYPQIPEPLIEQATTETTQALEQRVWRLRDRDVDARPILLRGTDAADRLLSAAREENADMIVTATRGRGGLTRLLVGSTATKLLRESDLPVLTVRGDGNGDPLG